MFDLCHQGELSIKVQHSTACASYDKLSAAVARVICKHLVSFSPKHC